LGSHISEEKDGAAAPLINSFIREIKEEVGLKTGVRGFQPIGYINQESDEVGRVHLGILNIVRTGFSIIKPADPEIAEGHMVYFHVANTILNHPDTEPEGWTKIVFPKIIDWFSLRHLYRRQLLIQWLPFFYKKIISSELYPFSGHEI